MSVKVTWNPRILAAVTQEVKREIVKQTEGVKSETVRLVMTTAKTGRTYTRRTVTHQASAPGEPFANDTGATLNGMRTEYRDGGFTGAVTGNKNHERLEYGTQKMEPRPSLRPALANKKQKIETGIAAAVRRGINRAR